MGELRLNHSYHLVPWQAAFTKHLIDLTGHIYCTERPLCVHG